MSDKEQSESKAEVQPLGIALNKVVSFHYRLSEVDEAGKRGVQMEESFGGEPLVYLHGFHNVVVGLERALEGKCPGDRVEIVLQPDDAYGMRNPNGIRRIPLKRMRLPNGVKKHITGQMAGVDTEKGIQRVTILKVGKFNCDVDFNHPYAGRALHYDVKVTDVRDATGEEIAHGHVHGAGGHQH